jgi:hypothetical protein
VAAFAAAGSEAPSSDGDHDAVSAGSAANLTSLAGSVVCDEESAVNYLLLICGDESVQLSPEESAAMARDTEAWAAEMDGRGIRLLGNRLRPVRDARSVRVREGELLVADGPFAETKEHIAGIDLLECSSLDEAIEVASRHPMARIGTVEVRAFWTDDEE